MAVQKESSPRGAGRARGGAGGEGAGGRIDDLPVPLVERGHQGTTGPRTGRKVTIHRAKQYFYGTTSLN